MTKPDIYQQKAILESKNILLIAAAGSGKTFTIIHKINYLLDHGIKPQDILLISFTNKSVNDLKSKINSSIDIFTFHKLAISILNYNNITYKIAPNDLLEYVTDEYFLSLNNYEIINSILKYFNTYSYDVFLKSYDYIKLRKIIITFIHLYKTNNKSIYNFNKYKKDEIFLLSIIINIYYLYEEELKSTYSLDYDDLIIEATNYTNNYKKYKYIIIDEFQDTSLIRWNLVNSLRLQNKATFFCVGDDYQSIFKFSGCDIDIFLNFTKFVNDSKVLKLKYTYRNSQELINIASSFIMKNKKQINKALISNKHLNKPIIIKYYIWFKHCFFKLLDKLIMKYNDILVLGRNNIDLYLFTNISPLNDSFIYKNKTIKYLTVHSAKGLEAEVIIIINLINDTYGFPNKIVNSSILKLVNKETTEMLYAEERRLFYVALTRSKNEVYLLCPIKNRSFFIKEIKYLIKQQNNS